MSGGIGGQPSEWLRSGTYNFNYSREIAGQIVPIAERGSPVAGELPLSRGLHHAVNGNGVAVHFAHDGDFFASVGNDLVLVGNLVNLAVFTHQNRR